MNHLATRNLFIAPFLVKGERDAIRDVRMIRDDDAYLALSVNNFKNFISSMFKRRRSRGILEQSKQRNKMMIGDDGDIMS